MNAPSVTPASAVSSTPHLIALGSNVSASVAEADPFLKNAIGQIVFWTLSGEVDLVQLKAALADAGSLAIPPEEPSPVVALHRACEAVAAPLHLSVVSLRRGEYALTAKPEKRATADGSAQEVASTVRTSAKIVNGSPQIEGPDMGLSGAYDASRGSLAAADIGAWLCAKLVALKAIGLRDRGGVYFVPVTAVARWEAIGRALKACSGHRIRTVPAMKSADAVDAILTALSTDTTAAVKAIDAELRSEGLGKHALKGREIAAGQLRERVAHYEALLGLKLDELRTSLDVIDGAIAVAILSANGG